jgi:hypothetical protein
LQLHDARVRLLEQRRVAFALLAVGASRKQVGLRGASGEQLVLFAIARGRLAQLLLLLRGCRGSETEQEVGQEMIDCARGTSFASTSLQKLFRHPPNTHPTHALTCNSASIFSLCAASASRAQSARMRST